MAVIDDPTIYADDPPPLPSCCTTRPARGSGGLILGGSARVLLPALPVTARGGLILGGAAMVTQPSSYAGVGVGGLLLGGRGVGAHYPPALGSGGLILGGTAIATGPQPSPSVSGSGGEETMGCAQCPDGAAVHWIIHIQGVTHGTCADCAALNGDWPLTWTGGCAWDGAGMGVCGPVSDAYDMVVGNGTVTVNLPWAAYIGPAAGWDCLSPLTLSNVGQTGQCHWPPSITIEPAP